MLGLWEIRICWLANISEDYSLPLWKAMSVRSYYSDGSLSASAGIEESQVIERALPIPVMWSICLTTKDTACLARMTRLVANQLNLTKQVNKLLMQMTEAKEKQLSIATSATSMVASHQNAESIRYITRSEKS